MSDRKPVMAANWKMNKNHLEGQLFIEELRNRLHPDDYERVEIVICPPFTALRTIQTTIDGDQLEIRLGAQNLHWEDAGAYTGEIAASMLTKLKVGYVIVGHSERREYFGETDEIVNRKVKAAIEGDLIPIMCVGETLEEREGGRAQEKIARQLLSGLSGVKSQHVAAMVVAYEPIWAIGTGRTASADDARETIAFIRAEIATRHSEAASEIRIQYGGSVKPGNIAEMMSQSDIDGALVGGASLDAADFASIIRFAHPQ